MSMTSAESVFRCVSATAGVLLIYDVVSPG